MRAGPLSNSKVIEMLNRYFVPVTSANEDTNDGGAASPAERAEHQRIYQDFYQKKLGVGDVHVYVVGPDGASIGGLDIGSAMDAAKEIAFLTSVTERLHTPGGPPLFTPHPQVEPPKVEPGAPAIHLVVRKVAGKISWNDFPSENWILLSRQEWDQILPAAGAEQGAHWTIPAPVAAKLAEWIYPQTEEHTRANRSRVDVADFRLTLVTRQGDLGRARIEAKVRLRHAFTPNRPSEDYANSELIGFVDFDLATRQVQRLRMVTQKGDYYTLPFTCSLVSVSRETLDSRR
jgi:hypothetical protein